MVSHPLLSNCKKYHRLIITITSKCCLNSSPLTYECLVTGMEFSFAFLSISSTVAWFLIALTFTLTEETSHHWYCMQCFSYLNALVFHQFQTHSVGDDVLPIFSF